MLFIELMDKEIDTADLMDSISSTILHALIMLKKETDTSIIQNTTTAEIAAKTHMDVVS